MSQKGWQKGKGKGLMNIDGPSTPQSIPQMPSNQDTWSSFQFAQWPNTSTVLGLGCLESLPLPTPRYSQMPHDLAISRFTLNLAKKPLPKYIQKQIGTHTHNMFHILEEEDDEDGSSISGAGPYSVSLGPCDKMESVIYKATVEQEALEDQGGELRPAAPSAGS